jgi:hypothetical protein
MGQHLITKRIRIVLNQADCAQQLAEIFHCEKAISLRIYQPEAISCLSNRSN